MVGRDPMNVIELLYQQAADLPRLRAAMRLRSVGPSVVGFVSGGAPSYELISLGVEALLADVRREVDECEQDLRLELGHRWWRSPQLDKALYRMADAYDGVTRALGATQSAQQAGRRVRSWQRRTRLLLGEAWAPYRLLWPTGQPVLCPVLEWRRGGARSCPGVLHVHRSDETGVPNDIRCQEVPEEHCWAAGPAWLRLGMLLGATA
jgi:hypothetical protein